MRQGDLAKHTECCCARDFFFFFLQSCDKCLNVNPDLVQDNFRKLQKALMRRGQKSFPLLCSARSSKLKQLEVYLSFFCILSSWWTDLIYSTLICCNIASFSAFFSINTVHHVTWVMSVVVGCLCQTNAWTPTKSGPKHRFRNKYQVGNLLEKWERLMKQKFIPLLTQHANSPHLTVNFFMKLIVITLGLCFPLGPFTLRLPNILQVLIFAAIVTIDFSAKWYK